MTPSAGFTAADVARWKRDPVAFIEEVLYDPETGRPYRLNRAQRRFVAKAFKLRPDGRLLYPEQVFSGPKKSGKTALAAMLVIYVVLILGGPFAEGYCVANDYEQAQGRVFQAIVRIIEASPLLKGEADIIATRITFPATGATIQPISANYATAAGANPNIVVFDELWAYASERSYRLWDEMVPPPTRKIACRITVTYAGYEGESVLLENLYKRGLKGEQVEPDLYVQPGMLMLWTHDLTAPWQTEEWRQQMHEQLRPNAYRRLIENLFVTSESTFIDMVWWDACTDPEQRPVLADRMLRVYVGIDASVKRDSTAIVVCVWDHELNRVRVIWHRIFQPSPDEPLDFEGTVEATMKELRDRFDVREVRYDPYQMAAVAQRLALEGLPMMEYPQSLPNLTAMGTNLYELIKGRNLTTYPDAAMRLAVQRAVAVEASRGWRIAKEKASHKIDVVVALAMAALGAVKEGQDPSLEMWKRLGEPAALPAPEPVVKEPPAPDALNIPLAPPGSNDYRRMAQRRNARSLASIMREGEPTVAMEIPKDIFITVASAIVLVPEGRIEVPTRLADHWYLKNNGARIADGGTI